MRLSLEPIEPLLAAVGDPAARASACSTSRARRGRARRRSSPRRCSARRASRPAPSPRRISSAGRSASASTGAEVEGDALAAAVERAPARTWTRCAAGPSRRASSTSPRPRRSCSSRRRGVDVAIVEVGLGGRLDSTNVGRARGLAASRASSSSTPTSSATRSPRSRARRPASRSRACPLVVGRARARGGSRGRGARAASSAARSRASATSSRVELLERGPFAARASASPTARSQAELALAAAGPTPASRTRRSRWPACGGSARWATPSSRAAAERAFASAVLPARIEICSRAPWIIVDGAHTAASARALAATLARVPRRTQPPRALGLGGKDLAAICARSCPQADRVTVTRAEPVALARPEARGRGACARWLRRAEVRVVPNPHLALRAAREALAPDDLLCAIGLVLSGGHRAPRAARDPERQKVERPGRLLAFDGEGRGSRPGRSELDEGWREQAPCQRRGDFTPARTKDECADGACRRICRGAEGRLGEGSRAGKRTQFASLRNAGRGSLRSARRGVGLAQAPSERARGARACVPQQPPTAAAPARTQPQRERRVSVLRRDARRRARAREVRVDEEGQARCARAAGRHAATSRGGRQFTPTASGASGATASSASAERLAGEQARRRSAHEAHEQLARPPRAPRARRRPPRAACSSSRPGPRRRRRRRDLARARRARARAPRRPARAPGW